jgi:RsiW-degrading membrane proteinase PrsW (M82 family)
MKMFLLTRVRLTVYFWGLFLVFFGASFFLPAFSFSGGALTLFSVNSFLYGFYISPILGGQKSRIEELHKIIRSEANALFAMQLKLKKLPDDLRSTLQDMFVAYTKAKTKGQQSTSGEKEYEAIISYCLNYKGEHQDLIDKLLDQVVANQQNRTQFTMQMSNRVYSNEWMIMFILFSITLGFIVLMDVGGMPLLFAVKALLCTGLTMLIVILIKLNTLTHKKARQMWQPFHKLLDTHFYRFD